MSDFEVPLIEACAAAVCGSPDTLMGLQSSREALTLNDSGV